MPISFPRRLERTPVAVVADIAVIAVMLGACGGEAPEPSREAASPASEEASSSRRAPAPRSLPALAAATSVSAVETLGGDPESIDLAVARSSGHLEIEVNDPSVQARVDALFDGNTESLVRSGAVNPLILTLNLQDLVTLTGVGIYPSYSTYDWVVEPLPGGDRFRVSGAPAKQWSLLELPEPVETSVVRIEVLRLDRDDYVHLNEIALFGD